MSIEDNAFNKTLQQEQAKLNRVAKPGKPKPVTLWMINTESRSYDWLVIAPTEAECLREFKRMWNSWCESTGADPYYWGSPGDKWSDVSCLPYEMGAGYMDREKFR